MRQSISAGTAAESKTAAAAGWRRTMTTVHSMTSNSGDSCREVRVRLVSANTARKTIITRLQYRPRSSFVQTLFHKFKQGISPACLPRRA